MLGDRFLVDLGHDTSPRRARKAHAGSSVHDGTQRIGLVPFVVLHVPAAQCDRECRGNVDLLVLYHPKNAVVHHFYPHADVITLNRMAW